jgi:uncharacterized protein YuzE
MTATIGGLVFESSNYDADGDVLYLGRGESNVAADALLTSEGHGVRFDSHGGVIGVTIINARRIIEQDGYLTITLPRSVRVDAGELAAVLG